jgi:hypothetical protein
LPFAVKGYESSTRTTWAGPSIVATFGEPLNNSPDTYCGDLGCARIYCAPSHLDARGSPNGQWGVAFQVENGGYNNIYVCRSGSGCGFPNAEAHDQFLAGVPVPPQSDTGLPDY